MSISVTRINSRQCCVKISCIVYSVLGIMCYYSYYYLDDFMIEDYNLTIPSASPINSTACFVFRPVNDMIVEGNETFAFITSAANELDVFDASDPFSLVIFDNDGKKQSLHAVIQDSVFQLTGDGTNGL